jgi:hypothetical protein
MSQALRSRPEELLTEAQSTDKRKVLPLIVATELLI